MLITKCGIEWLNEDGEGYAINPFVGCGNGCYKGKCWAYLEAKRHGRVRSWEEWQRPKLNSRFQGQSLRVQVASEAGKLPRGANILLSATTDPFQFDFFGYNSIVENILHGLSWVKNGPQIWILTKSGTGLVRFQANIVDCKAKVGVTITSLETNREWEPHADQPGLRLLALKQLKEAGLSTYISIEPIIPHVTAPRDIIERTRDYTDWYILGSFNYAGVDKNFYKETMPSLLEWLKAEGISFFIKRELRKEVTVHS